MHELVKVVVRFLDGRLLKGNTDDFAANRPSFHLWPAGGGPIEEVQCKDLKAVFFVKDFGGDPQRQDKVAFSAARDDNQGKRAVVQFKDGEVICGYTLAYTPDRKGFFVTPADPAGNNIRVYVLAHATRAVGVGVKADALLAKIEPRRAA